MRLFLQVPSPLFQNCEEYVPALIPTFFLSENCLSSSQPRETPHILIHKRSVLMKFRVKIERKNVTYPVKGSEEEDMFHCFCKTSSLTV